jgi:hypothetical protein
MQPMTSRCIGLCTHQLVRLTARKHHQTHVRKHAKKLFPLSRVLFLKECQEAAPRRLFHLTLQISLHNRKYRSKIRLKLRLNSRCVFLLQHRLFWKSLELRLQAGSHVLVAYDWFLQQFFERESSR